MDRCIQTHDKARGTLRTLQKEDLQREITRPLELGSDDLLEDDQYLKNVIFDLQLNLVSNYNRTIGYTKVEYCLDTM